MGNEIIRIKAFGKNAIIEIAIDIIEKKYPALKLNLNDFEITIWANKKEILVRFKRSIKYFPLNKKQSNLNYDLSVNVITGKIEPLDIWGITKFYVPSKEEIKKIEFVKNNFNLPLAGFDNEISEEADRYRISTSNEVAYGIYYIDKITGEELPESIQGSYVPAPEIREDKVNEDPLIEIEE